MSELSRVNRKVKIEYLIYNVKSYAIDFWTIENFARTLLWKRNLHLLKEIGDIATRLFDHRPFLNGEIKFMLKEFEEKRGDREVENLFSIIENYTEVKDTQVEKIAKTGEIVLPTLNEKLDQSLKLVAEIENTYSDVQKICSEQRTKKHEKRQKEWDNFIKDMNFNCQRIDNTFEEKEEELRDLYADLNHKLNINK